MAADLQAKGNILVEIPKYDEAKRQFDRSFQMIQSSNLSQEIKDNSTLMHHFNLTALAIAQKDIAAAKTHTEEFRRGVEKSKNVVQQRQYHELAGRLALAQKDYDQAIAELAQANQQDPRNIYRQGEAYQGKGDSAMAQAFYTKAAGFNTLPALNYAFIRARAHKAAAAGKTS
jgi:tetratricopeptide (TPR) repeat protein